MLAPIESLLLKIEETWYAGIFYLGYAVFQIPSNMVITRVGAPLWLGILIFCWGTVAACTSTMKNAGQYYAVRFLLGATLGLITLHLSYQSTFSLLKVL